MRRSVPQRNAPSKYCAPWNVKTFKWNESKNRGRDRWRENESSNKQNCQRLRLHHAFFKVSYCRIYFYFTRHSTKFICNLVLWSNKSHLVQWFRRKIDSNQRDKKLSNLFDGISIIVKNDWLIDTKPTEEKKFIVCMHIL